MPYTEQYYTSTTNLFLVTLVNSLWSKSRVLTLKSTVPMKDGQNRSDRTCVRACGVDFHKNGCGKEERRKHFHLH